MLLRGFLNQGSVALADLADNPGDGARIVHVHPPAAIDEGAGERAVTAGADTLPMPMPGIRAFEQVH
ncbi:hypothetical protein D3C79_996470 [compost metagenome]